MYFIPNFSYVLVAGPPPPPLPPPLKAPNPNNQTNQLNNKISQQNRHSPVQVHNNMNQSDNPDSDSGFEVLEEPTLRPSELVKGNHNRTMSSISGKC